MQNPAQHCSIVYYDLHLATSSPSFFEVPAITAVPIRGPPLSALLLIIIFAAIICQLSILEKQLRSFCGMMNCLVLIGVSFVLGEYLQGCTTVQIRNNA